MKIQKNQFRAPEEYIKEAPQTAAIDVWALGSIFAELVSGLPVWYGVDEAVAQESIVQGTRPPLLERVKNSKDPINNVLLQAIDKCWVHDAKDRPRAGIILEFLKTESERLGIQWNKPFTLNGR